MEKNILQKKKLTLSHQKLIDTKVAKSFQNLYGWS